MQSPALLHRFLPIRQVTPVSFLHNHAKRIEKLNEKFKEKNSKELWLKEHGPGGSVKHSTPYSSKQIEQITLDFAKKKNALTGSMMYDFSSIVKKVVRDTTHRVVVVRGANGSFCSGGDLNFVEKIASEEGAFVMNSVMMNAVNKLARSDKVSIAVLEGFTMGGGTELASACDIRVAKKNAKVGFVQGRMGVCPGWGGGRYLVETLGRARAIEYLTTAAEVTAEELHRIGYVNFVYDSEEELESYLNRFNALRTDPFIASKRMVANYSRESSLSEEEKEMKEQLIFMSVWGQNDHKDNIHHIRQSIKAKKEKK
ncbi:hypothetical protein PFISCL1PPCAC_26884 [Pristionchus fissidentatus]|uniref:Ethylmalonyl-CoA decarboxylase n=1 Tax=Pristionchus fissidentatus TaxID=1538716 RepID=A0AAV5WUA1_9BILA|nr:hypothetical protein PFISCL1PPCAC_26884 [Pristionchus fissidentatus]